ncbi:MULTISPECIES: VOC family protein [Halorussus]|uniref:VOC family protein n=1 Tax=Halorussus TaxID=1070314 RepID=UPI0020A206D6|nr:VOC family protein [Halorussus vallis]USZ74427.1 VOC family protein [Halorussus vallis]
MESPLRNRIGNVFVPVSDMERSVEWYSELFGLPAEDTAHEGTIYDVEMAGETGLVLDANRPVENSSQPLYFFWTDDAEATRDFLVDLDVPVVMGPEDVGSVTFVTFEDPDGNQLMACQKNDRNPPHS